MYLSLDWLRDFVDIPKSITPETLGEKLTMHTVEIDDVLKEGDKFKNIVVGKILEVKKHPNADKLQLVVVDVKKETLEIVCGAPNINPGQLVPVALVGAELPNGMEIKETEIRGVKSSGMLCAEDEIGLGEDHDGILILEARAKVGENFSDYLKLKDVIFEVDNKSITHRPDLWGHYGISREVAAFLKTKTTKLFRSIVTDEIKVESEDIEVSVKVNNPKDCSRYTAVAMNGIKVEESPEWLKDRLTAVGVRPISNIVDVTNYVMLELGQPMHAFDAKLLTPTKGNDSQANIVVRGAYKDEEMLTLDGEKRILDEGMILITNGEEAVGIGGVMGGENSEINDDTKVIVLEAATFDYVSIRKTSQKLGLRTEASKRFEKSLDPNLCAVSITRAVSLIKKVCKDAKIVSRVADERNFKLDQGPIEFSLVWLDKFIGAKINKDEVIKILTLLGFTVEDKKESLKVTIPTWRATKDISIKEDLAEEIARIYGYNELKPDMPLVKMQVPEVNEEKQFERKIKTVLTGGGLSEVCNYHFVGEELLQKLGADMSTHVRLANPLTRQHTMLRQSLLTNLLLNIKTNQARYDNIKLFETGAVYANIPGDIVKDDKGGCCLPFQEKRLGIIEACEKESEVFDSVKGKVELLFKRLNLDLTFLETDNNPLWASPSTGAKIMAGENEVGQVAAVSSPILKKLGIKKKVAALEINLKELRRLSGVNTVNFREPEKFPAAIRDLAFVVKEKILYNDIRNTILSFHKYIKKADLFDVYRGEKLGKDNKNLAFHVIYQAEKTLTSEEVDEIQAALIKEMENKFEAKVRDF